MKIATTRFGEIDHPLDEVIEFPEGFPGVASRRFLLVTCPENDGLVWLQSTDEADIAFLTIDPARLLERYKAAPKPAEIRALRLADGEDLVVRVIVWDAEDRERCLLNLFAPVLLNMSKRLGMQVPLVGSGYGLKEPWPMLSAAEACAQPKTDPPEDA